MVRSVEAPCSRITTDRDRRSPAMASNLQARFVKSRKTIVVSCWRIEEKARESFCLLIKRILTAIPIQMLMKDSQWQTVFEQGLVSLRPGAEDKLLCDESLRLRFDLDFMVICIPSHHGTIRLDRRPMMVC